MKHLVESPVSIEAAIAVVKIMRAPIATARPHCYRGKQYDVRLADLELSPILRIGVCGRLILGSPILGSPLRRQHRTRPPLVPTWCVAPPWYEAASEDGPTVHGQVGVLPHSGAPSPGSVSTHPPPSWERRLAAARRPEAIISAESGNAQSLLRAGADV